MFVIPNSTKDKSSITTTMFVNINIILQAVRLFLAERDARFGVF